MDLLTFLMPYLQQLGPWGWAVAAGIVILQTLRARRSPASSPPAPVSPAIEIPRPTYAAGTTEADDLVALMQHAREAVATKLIEHEAEAQKLRDIQTK